MTGSRRRSIPRITGSSTASRRTATSIATTSARAEAAASDQRRRRRRWWWRWRWRWRGRRTRQRRAGAGGGDGLHLPVELADSHLAAQPAQDPVRRRSLLRLAGSRRHVDDVAAAARQEPRFVRAHDHGHPLQQSGMRTWWRRRRWTRRQRPAAGGPPPTTCILSKGDGVGANEAGTILEIAESPVVPNLYWAGTGDGNVQMSQDGGLTWTEVGRNVPGGTREYWVSGLEASWFDAGTAYLALDGHHFDDLRPHVFKTTDYGKTWTSIAGNLPTGQRQLDPAGSGQSQPALRRGRIRLLHLAGRRQGVASVHAEPADGARGRSRRPSARSRSRARHARSQHLDHGRHLAAAADGARRRAPTRTLFRPRDAVAWRPDPRNGTSIPGSQWWGGENAPPGTAIAYYLRSAPAGDVRVTIANTATGPDGAQLHRHEGRRAQPLPVDALD